MYTPRTHTHTHTHAHTCTQIHTQTYYLYITLDSLKLTGPLKLGHFFQWLVLKPQPTTFTLYNNEKNMLDCP